MVIEQEIERGTVTTNGVEFGYLTCGSGPLALCLHGFPDSAHTWRHLLPALADVGFRAVAPFQRGYAPTAVPADGRYQSGALAADANALHDALGGGADAVIIGHDWGAPATYGAACFEPDRWRAVVAMAVPSGGAVNKAFLGNFAQLKRSWYMFFFQHGLADVIVGINDLAFIDGLWADWSPGYDASSDLVAVKDALRQPANLQAALGYYRARLGDGYRDPALESIQEATGLWPSQPTLYIHGRNDGCIGVEVAQAAAAEAPPNVRIEYLDDCGHFLQLERPTEVNAMITGFVT